ncbi:MAG: ATP-binding cassette domain-containing protein [Bacteroidetes bacterium]|nr:MAG: ATP-binding cassette domain-containing protein [Bacteroidota bacterium]REK06507.1 MAG: ATP-binding cassette domain-containing protein [Bacteroidota bacterium]REK33273.1 MAG: ATP-binding cassette domain-containing protein [Bacteroidota bacterium]REK47110.1 MAG: ATP-binding cassette domain-containing protein [Bacteroidota bacterium]
MLEIRNLQKQFNRGTANEITAVDKLNFQAWRGEFIILVGSNGSGKSTLLNLIAGNLNADSGSIKLNGDEIVEYKEHERSRLIGRIFQNPLSGTSPDLSILENFRLAYLRDKCKSLRIGTGNDFREMISEKIRELNMGLEKKLDQEMGKLSGGQRQALTLLMSVFARPTLLLLDEPTAALDPKSSVQLMKLTEMLIQDNQITAILVTHNLKDALQYGNRILQMSEGKIIRDFDAESKKNLNLNELVSWF